MNNELLKIVQWQDSCDSTLADTLDAYSDDATVIATERCINEFFGITDDETQDYINHNKKEHGK